MHPGWSSVLFLLPLISVGSRADICIGEWESLEGGGKVVVKGSLSTSPSQPFIVDFHHFAQLGRFCLPEFKRPTRPYCLYSLSAPCLPLSPLMSLYLMLPRTWVRGQHLYQGECSVLVFMLIQNKIWTPWQW